MPSDFPPDIKNLIQRMICVDVSNRITLEEIKQHPAFLKGMPGNYVIPTPIKLNNLTKPIDPESIPETVFLTLSRIGIEEEEAKKALLSDESNQVKEFVDMAMQGIHMEDLPWENAVKDLPSRQGFEGFGEEVVTVEGLPKPSFTFSLSDVPQSLVTRPSWLPPVPQYNFQDSDVFGPSSRPLVEVMAQLQEALLKAGLVFLHPNDMTLLAKYDDESYMRLDAEISEPGVIVTVKLTGQIPLLKSLLFARITEITYE